jgi:hypothetical protein
MKNHRAASSRILVILVSALSLVVRARAASAADKDIRPFVGIKFGTDSTFVNPDGAAGQPKIVYGATATIVGEIIGAGVDFSDAPGFFTGDLGNVIGSRVTTLTSNLIVAVPRHLTQYTLRPYVTAGAGFIRVSIDDPLHAIPVAEIQPAMDVGGGVIGFITKRVGLCWELRRFQSFRTSTDPGISVGALQPQLSFWRANMGIALRY